MNNYNRPASLKEFVGQPEICSRLDISVGASNYRRDAMGHCLFYGPPGLGKTTLAGTIANDLGVQIHIIEGPMLRKPADLTGILMSLQPRDVLFIDEVHSIDTRVEEYLYHAMEDFVLDIITGIGEGARTLRIPIAPFTLIGATTMVGKLSKPLRDRFIYTFQLLPYDKDTLKLIVAKYAEYFELKLDRKAIEMIAASSRGTPRIAKKFLKWLKDVADHEQIDIMDMHKVAHALEYIGIDQNGLDQMDRNILRAIRDKFGSGPVGIDAVASYLGEPAVSLQNMHEPYLVQAGFLTRTSRGRILSKQGKEYLKKLDLIDV